MTAVGGQSSLRMAPWWSKKAGWASREEQVNTHHPSVASASVHASVGFCQWEGLCLLMCKPLLPMLLWVMVPYHSSRNQTRIGAQPGLQLTANPPALVSSKLWPLASGFLDCRCVKECFYCFKHRSKGFNHSQLQQLMQNELWSYFYHRTKHVAFSRIKLIIKMMFAF